ncbi:hypothetical protein [Streptomyces sp. NPDC001970]
MTVISEKRRGSFLGVVERSWKKSGYKITAVNEDRERPAVYAVTTDGFGISLVIGDKGQAFFEVDSPCVRESEVADPTRMSHGPSYAGTDIPYPNVHSDFWSASAPTASPSPTADASP